MGKQHLKLTEQEHRYLTTLTTSGQLKARKFKRAMTLLLLDEGNSMKHTSETLKFSYPRVLALRDNYLANGLRSLEEKPRTGRPSVIDGAAKAKITALACSPAPGGHAQWSLRLLADKAVELELVSHISHNEVGEILKKTNSNRI